jgi:hypothetical protein
VVEHVPFKHRVAGSSPARLTILEFFKPQISEYRPAGRVPLAAPTLLVTNAAGFMHVEQIGGSFTPRS